MPLLTMEQTATMASDIENGMSIRNAVKKYSVSWSAVHNHIDALNRGDKAWFEPIYDNMKLIQEEIRDMRLKQIVALYNERFEFPITAKAMRDRLRRYEFEYVRNGDKPRTRVRGDIYGNLTNAIRETLVESTTRLSAADIARITGLPSNRVLNALSRMIKQGESVIRYKFGGIYYYKLFYEC